MRIITENAQNYIQRLAGAIGKDPASLESWRCMHIKQTGDIPEICPDSLLLKLKERHPDWDCDIVCCADKDMLLVSSTLFAEQLYKVAEEITHATGNLQSEPDVMLYDVFSEWRAVRSILLTKAGEPSVPVVEPAANGHSFGDVSALQEVFAEAKQMRKARMPLHVMIVEDDPLTRRLVTGAFKEKYALITAANAEEAVANYLLHAPDIVFLDIGLPDVSGFEVLSRIMKSDPDAYVVMFSGNSYLDNITAALGIGAAGFVAKPFKKEKIQRYIHDSALHHRKYM